jgi:DNA-binding GntR family transcriptional regulator
MYQRSTTAYGFIADVLRREVMRGTLEAGARLPTERELCTRFAASRITVRRALQILADELLVVRRQGSGTFVSATPSRKIPLLNTDFNGSLAQHAPDLTRRLESTQWESASESVATYLQTFPGARVLFARRIDLLEDVPVAYDEIYLREDTADLLTDVHLARLDFLQELRSVQQIQFSHLTQSVEATVTGESEARHLAVAVGATVLKEIDVLFLQTGTPCGLFVSFYRHDLFRLTSTVRFIAEPVASSIQPRSRSENLVPAI